MRLLTVEWEGAKLGLEIDETVFTPEKGVEFMSFWHGGEDIIETEHDGRVYDAVAATVFLHLLISEAHNTNAALDLFSWAEGQFSSPPQEGFPDMDGQYGLKIVEWEPLEVTRWDLDIGTTILRQEVFMNILNPENDDKIRAALKKADEEGQLDAVARQVGIAGGSAALREIMNSTGELHTMDRGMLSMHVLGIS